MAGVLCCPFYPVGGSPLSSGAMPEPGVLLESLSLGSRVASRKPNARARSCARFAPSASSAGCSSPLLSPDDALTGVCHRVFPAGSMALTKTCSPGSIIGVPATLCGANALGLRRAAEMFLDQECVCAFAENVKVPCGEEHPVRKRIAKQIIKCAQGGRTTLIELTDAGPSAFGRVWSRPQNSCVCRNARPRASRAPRSRRPAAALLISAILRFSAAWRRIGREPRARASIIAPARSGQGQHPVEGRLCQPVNDRVPVRHALTIGVAIALASWSRSR